MSRLVTLLVVALVCSTVRAQVLEVFIWDPLPGVPNSGPQTFENGMKAKRIQQKHGAQVTVAQDHRGMMHFVRSHDDYAARHKFYTSLDQDDANAAFWREVNATPKADLETTYTLDVVAPGKGGSVYEVFVWQPLPGRVSDMLEAGLGAKPLHEKAGAGVMIAVDRLNRMHYVLQFDGWEQYAKFWDAPNPEFEAYMEKVSQDPTAELVKNYRASEM